MPWCIVGNHKREGWGLGYHATRQSISSFIDPALRERVCFLEDWEVLWAKVGQRASAIRNIVEETCRYAYWCHCLVWPWSLPLRRGILSLQCSIEEQSRRRSRRWFICDPLGRGVVHLFPSLDSGMQSTEVVAFQQSCRCNVHPCVTGHPA
jgi:hypothetical protein